MKRIYEIVVIIFWFKVLVYCDKLNMLGVEIMIYFYIWCLLYFFVVYRSWSGDKEFLIILLELKLLWGLNFIENDLFDDWISGIW